MIWKIFFTFDFTFYLIRDPSVIESSPVVVLKKSRVDPFTGNESKPSRIVVRRSEMMLILIKKRDFQKLVGLWLTGKMVDRIGIYGFKVAEVLPVFQRRSCWWMKCPRAFRSLSVFKLRYLSWCQIHDGLSAMSVQENVLRCTYYYVVEHVDANTDTLYDNIPRILKVAVNWLTFPVTNLIEPFCRSILLSQ